MRILALSEGFETELTEALLGDDHYTFCPVLRTSRVWSSILESLKDATHVAVEYDYFDADGRSTASLTLSRRHDPKDLISHRLVFFRLDRGYRVGMGDPVAGLHAFDLLIDAGRLKALGYVLLCDESAGLVGRSLLPPPESLANTVDGIEVAKHVRAAVTETIAVSGKLIEVYGVPFMKQDGNIMTCSHVSAWCSHYSAAMRGLARRRHTADFHNIPGERLVHSRSIPSNGLTDWQLTTLLEKIGLPAAVVDHQEAIRPARTARWCDRQVLWDMTAKAVAAAGIDPPDNLSSEQQLSKLMTEIRRRAREGDESTSQRAVEFQNAHLKFWTRESVTASICRQLNSGFPAIVVHPPHSYVVNGYLRNRDTDTNHAYPTEVSKLICSDDQEGPYVLKDVAPLVEAVSRGRASVLLPLPHGVWLKGDTAERLGTQFFLDAVKEVLGGDRKTANERGFVVYPNSLEMEALYDRLAELEDQAGVPDSFAARSYVVTATDFRRGLSRRNEDRVLQSKARFAKLPKFVWVVEIMDRIGREGGRPAVLGEVVLDASSVDQRQARALLTHVPGMVQVSGRGTEGSWHILERMNHYRSGRYHSGKDWHTDPQSVVSRWKYSV